MGVVGNYGPEGNPNKCEVIGESESMLAL